MSSAISIEVGGDAVAVLTLGEPGSAGVFNPQTIVSNISMVGVRIGRSPSVSSVDSIRLLAMLSLR